MNELWLFLTQKMNELMCKFTQKMNELAFFGVKNYRLVKKMRLILNL